MKGVRIMNSGDCDNGAHRHAGHGQVHPEIAEHSEYHLVETAFGGVSRRNIVKEKAVLEFPADARECYTSMYSFTSELVAHVQDTGSVQKVSHLIVWSDICWFDIDSPDLDVAKAATIDLVAKISAIDEALAQHLVIYFSGCKGFHVGLPSTLAGLKPSAALPSQHRQLALALAEGIDIDTSIYQHTRLWRVPNTINAKSGLYKVRLTVEQLRDWGVDEIKEYAKQPRGQPYLDTVDGIEKLSVCDRLVELAESASQERNTTKPRQPTDSDPRDQDWIASALQCLKEGNRHSTFVKIIGKLISDEYSVESILALLSPHAARVSFEIGDLSDLVHDLWDRYRVDPISTAIGHIEQRKDTAFIAVSLADFITAEDSETAWLVHNLIPAGGATILAGPAGCGKSFMLMDLALALATGTEFLGRYLTTECSVLYIDEESSPAEIRRRFRRLLAGRGLHQAPQGIAIMAGQGVRIDDPDSLSRLDQLLSHLQPDVVLIDSLIRVHGAEENSATEMSRVFGIIKRLMSKHNCSFVIIDHQRKPGQQRSAAGYRLRGSSEKLAFADALLSVEVRETGIILLEHTKCRCGPEQPSAVVKIEDQDDTSTTVIYVGEADEYDPKIKAAEEFFENVIGDEGAFRKDIVDGAREEGISERSIGKALSELAKSGQLVKDKVSAGRGAPQHRYRWARNLHNRSLGQGHAI